MLQKVILINEKIKLANEKINFRNIIQNLAIDSSKNNRLIQKFIFTHDLKNDSDRNNHSING